MPSVGEIIKAEREKKGLSIKDIEKGTSIRSLYLQAIEDGNYSIVPGEVYLKGFIRNYANYIGLNGQDMVNMYKESQNVIPQQPVAVEGTSTTAPKSEETNETEAEENSTFRNRLREERMRSTSLPSSKKWVAAVAVLVIAGGIYFWQANSQSLPKQDKPGPETTAVQPAPQPQTPSQTPAAQNQPVAVIAKYTEPCWTSVTADGKKIYEGTPKAGETLTWEAQQNIVVRVGNAGAVDFTHNGKPIGKIGGKGEVTVKTFAK